jgi:HK97 family phage prohead protease
VLGWHESEAGAKTQEEAIKANESRDVEALRGALAGQERRFAVAQSIVEADPGADFSEYGYDGEIELRRTDRGPQIAMWIPFNSISRDLGGFREVIRPSAFSRTVKNRTDVVALWNHDPGLVLGRRSNRMLTIGLSEKGAEAVVQLDNDGMHKEFARRVERRDVTGASFGFSAVQDKWGTDEEHDNAPLRELLEVKLFDISPVTFPAYEESGSEKRSLVEVVTAQSGEPFDELVAALTELRDGKVKQEHADLVRAWSKRLDGYLPPAPGVDLITTRLHKLRLLERKVS